MRTMLCGVFAALLAVGCASSKPVPVEATAPVVVAETQDVDERDRDLGGLNAVVSVVLRNSGETALTASKASYELVTGGKVTGKGELALANAVVPAGGETRLEIPVPFRYAHSEDELAALLDRKEPIEFAVRGTIAVGGETVEFARASRLKAPRLPVLKLASVDALNSPSQGLTVNASIEVENPNPFPLRLQGIRWKLDAARMSLGEGLVGRNAVVKPASTTSYELSLNLDTAELKKRSLKVGGTLAYRVTGELDLAPTIVRLDKSGDARVLRDGD